MWGRSQLIASRVECGLTGDDGGLKPRDLLHIEDALPIACLAHARLFRHMGVSQDVLTPRLLNCQPLKDGRLPSLTSRFGPLGISCHSIGL